jgi:hypothetical protein
MMNAQNLEVSKDNYDATVAEAKLRSRNTNAMQWVQVAWTGGNKDRRCWHWDGYFFGKKIAAVVWFRTKGYSAWAAGKKVIVDGHDAFRTLATAQEEAMFVASEIPFAIIDAFTYIPTFHTAAQRSIEPKAAAVAAGIGSFLGFVLEVRATREAERQAIIDAAKLQFEAFNAKFSSRGRDKYKGETMNEILKTKPTLTRAHAKEQLGNLSRSFAELEASMDTALDTEGQEIVRFTLSEVGEACTKLVSEAQNGIIEG